MPNAISDEREISFWRFSLDDPRLRLSRHIVFNLTRPEQSLLVLAPLAVKAGGLQLCRDAAGRNAPVFADTHDPDYQGLLAMAAAGKEELNRHKRFDLPGFQPPAAYVREMRRFGILPAEEQPDEVLDGYELDQAYWQSLWYRSGSATTAPGFQP